MLPAAVSQTGIRVGVGVGVMAPMALRCAAYRGAVYHQARFGGAALVSATKRWNSTAAATHAQADAAVCS